MRRVSTGGSPARIAYGAAVAAVESLAADGRYADDETWLDRSLSDRAWGGTTP